MSALVSVRRSTRETLLLAERSLRHIPRVPEKLADATIMPIVFIFTFAYVFGSAITVPGGGDYHEYLIGGMFAQGAFQPLQGLAVGVAEDMRTGLVDRLIFWKEPEKPGIALDTRRESQRLRENAALGREATEGETPIIQRSQSSNPVTRLFESIF